MHQLYFALNLALRFKYPPKLGCWLGFNVEFQKGRRAMNEGLLKCLAVDFEML